MKIILTSVRIFLAWVIICGSLVFRPIPTMAWEQGASGTHEEINRQAVIRFFNSMSSNPKFENSPLDKTKTYLANQTTSATLAQSGFKIAQNSLRFEDWLPHGGFSADEPEIWACVRHFYDPLSVNGGHQLTDHSWLHGLVYDAISAKQWAFEDPSNPYSWRKAMEYYKKAMEIPEDAKITVVPGTDFRDPAITVTSNDQARNVYLGKAFRALGETMHMMADLTQPAHVRNDSHPNGDLDPIESTANRQTVLLVKGSPVDPTAESAIATAANAADMYESIALYTNRNFYTDDTIYDKASGVNPRNWESAYQHPQFSDLILDKSSQQKTYYKELNGKQVRMAQQTYTSWKLGDKNWQDYIVPPSFMVEQAEVLMPIAIRANSKLINSFFPTMDLKMEIKESSPKPNDANYKEFAITSPFKHSSGSDADWQMNGLSIQYSGPGELWVESEGKEKKLGNLTYKGEALEKPVAVFAGDKSYAKTDLYQVNNKDNIFVIVNAGGRIFKSNKYAISAQTDITISPSEVTLTPGGKQTFAVKVSGASNPASTWMVDEGQTGGEINSTSGAYTAPTKTGTYHVTATLNSDKTKKASAVITVANVTVTVKPPIATVAPKATQTFTAEITGSSDKRVTWSVAESGGGTITADGVYTGPEKGGTFHIVATSKTNSQMTGQAVITVVTASPTPTPTTTVPAATNFKITPEVVTLLPSAPAIHLSITPAIPAASAVTWINQEIKTNNGGLYNQRDNGIELSIPETPGTYHIVATFTIPNQGQVSATATVYVVQGVWKQTSRKVTVTGPSPASFPHPTPTPVMGTGTGSLGWTWPMSKTEAGAPAANATVSAGCTWPEPPAQIKVGGTFNGILGLNETVSVTNPPYPTYKFDWGFGADASFYAPYGGLDFVGSPSSTNTVYVHVAPPGNSVSLPWNWTQSASNNFVITPKNKPVHGAGFQIDLNFTTNGTPGYSSVGGTVSYFYTLSLP